MILRYTKLFHFSSDLIGSCVILFFTNSREYFPMEFVKYSLIVIE